MADVEDDQSVENLLALWGLNSLSESFKDEGIDRETLLTMPSDAVKELIPKLGPRCTFLRKRGEYNQKNSGIGDIASTQSGSSIDNFNNGLSLPGVESNVDSWNSRSSSSRSDALNSGPPSVCSEKSDTSGTSTSSRRANGQHIKRLLAESATGQAILKTVRLTDRDRHRLVGIIIEHELNKDLKITTETLDFWATEIDQAFEFERKPLYFVPYQRATKQAASGKLWDKYTNTKKYLKKHILPVEEKKSSHDCQDDERSLLQLRTVSPEDVELARTLWEKTFNLREKSLSIATYYQEYPILSTPIGSSLLLLDFQLYKVSSDPDGFLKNWPEIAPIVVDLANAKRVKQWDLEADIPVEVLGLLKLPYLFRPSLVKTGNSKKWKPSSQEQAEGFLCIIAVMSDLETAIVNRKAKLLQYGLTCQPLAIAVGDPKNFEAVYVIVNGVKYTASNLVGAIDMCFKILFALNAKYSAESEVVWVFLQQLLYEIKGSKHFVTVESVISDVLTNQKLNKTLEKEAS